MKEKIVQRAYAVRVRRGSPRILHECIEDGLGFRASGVSVIDGPTVGRLVLEGHCAEALVCFEDLSADLEVFVQRSHRNAHARDVLLDVCCIANVVEGGQGDDQQRAGRQLGGPIKNLLSLGIDIGEANGDPSLFQNPVIGVPIRQIQQLSLHPLQGIQGQLRLSVELLQDQAGDARIASVACSSPDSLERRPAFLQREFGIGDEAQLPCGVRTCHVAPKVAVHHYLDGVRVVWPAFQRVIVTVHQRHGSAILAQFLETRSFPSHRLVLRVLVWLLEAP